LSFHPPGENRRIVPRPWFFAHQDCLLTRFFAHFYSKESLNLGFSSFKAADRRQAPIEVVLLIDIGNTGSENVDMLREGINRFLRADEGRLADQRTTALRNISRTTDSYGAAARFQIALQGLRRLVARESGRPGRKLIVWFSPGLPVLTGSQRLDNAKQEQQVFGDIVDISAGLREFHIMHTT
jgi:hypothetical protein